MEAVEARATEVFALFHSSTNGVNKRELQREHIRLTDELTVRSRQGRSLRLDLARSECPQLYDIVVSEADPVHAETYAANSPRFNCSSASELYQGNSSRLRDLEVLDISSRWNVLTTMYVLEVILAEKRCPQLFQVIASGNL